MATAHQLAVITNSCIKAPLSSQSGPKSTHFDGETSGPYSTGDVWAETSTGGRLDRAAEQDFSKSHLSQSVNFDTTLMQTLNADLSTMSDAEFYQRLTELKKEHKKTLEFCEKLYHEKLSDSRTAASGSPQRPITIDDEAETDNFLSSSLNRSLGSTSEVARIFAEDHVRDMSAAKPPTGRPRTSEGRPQRVSPSPQRQAWTASRSLGASDDYSKITSGHSSEAELSGDELLRSLSKANADRSLVESIAGSQMSSRSRIDEMWENFSVNDYAPSESRKIRPRSSSLSRLSTSSLNKENKPKEKEWRHRLTIPKPFSMTLREANKTPKKTKAMEEMEQQREEKQRQEEEECQKKFKAKPVPAHVYMPLFDEIMEGKEAKRREVRAASAKQLQSTQKPFKFDVREEDKKKFRRSHSSPISSDLKKRPKTTFKARPFPEHLFVDSTMDRLKEEEEYRKIRIQMRAQELLKTSKLPSNMEATSQMSSPSKLKSEVYAQKAKKAGFTREQNFKPRINGTVPDFEELHNKFLMEASRRKEQKEATVCKPFKLSSGHVVSKRHKIYEDIARDEDSLRDNSWQFHSERSRPLSKSVSALSTSMDSLPTKMTTAAQLRSSTTKDKIRNQLEKELLDLEKERHKRQREKKLQKYIAERASDNDNTCILENYNKKKLKEFRQAERARQEEYRQQLAEMNQRIKSRPLLFEKTMQDNAKRRAEKRYQKTLQRAGIEDDFLARKSLGADAEGGLDSEGYDDEGSPSPHYSDDEVTPEPSRSHSYSHQSRTASGTQENGYSGLDDDPGAQTGDDQEDIAEDVQSDYDEEN